MIASYLTYVVIASYLTYLVIASYLTYAAIAFNLTYVVMCAAFLLTDISRFLHVIGNQSCPYYQTNKVDSSTEFSCSDTGLACACTD